MNTLVFQCFFFAIKLQIYEFYLTEFINSIMYLGGINTAKAGGNDFLVFESMHPGHFTTFDGIQVDAVLEVCSKLLSCLNSSGSY